MTSYIPASYTAPGGGDSPVFRPEIIQHNRRHASEKKDMLRCFICQGNGSSEMKFSDVSHLITHVNSKGHLISKNNLEILALGVPQAQETLDDFMAWEERHGIKKLSFDRITNKAQGDQAEQDERKDKHTREPQEERGRTKSRGGHASARGKMRGGRRGSTRGRGGQRAHSSRDGHNLNSVVPSIESPREVDDGTDSPYPHLNQSPASFLDNQSTMSKVRRTAARNVLKSSSRRSSAKKGRRDDDDDSYQASERARSVSSSRSTSTAADRPLGSPFMPKGMVLPGMGGFDAAPEDQRRTRNQRKPDQVMDGLEISSTLVTTVEMVYDMNLQPLRERDVYDDPSEDEGAESDQADEGDDDDEYRLPGQLKRSAATTSAVPRGKKSRSTPAYLSRPGSSASVRSAHGQAQSTAGASVNSAQFATFTGGAARTASASGQAMAAQQQAPAHNHGLHDSVFSSALNPSGWMSVEQMCQLMMFPPQYPAAASHPGGQLHHANEQDGQGRYPTPSGDDEMQIQNHYQAWH